MELLAQGYEFLFVIDPYDIVQNFFPSTVEALFSRNFNYEVTRQLPYYDFFNSAENRHITLLDEYKIELIAIKDQLIKKLRDARILLDNICQLNEKANFHTEEEKSLLLKNLDVIIMLFILNDRRSNVYEEFITLLNDKLLVTSKEISNIEPNGIVGQIIMDSTTTALSCKVFECFVNQNRYKSTDKINDENRRFMENSFRDICVIERVININQQFIKQNLRFRAVYLSSAIKSAVLIKLFQQEVAKEYGDLTVGQCCVHRNIFQHHLQTLFRGPNEDIVSTIALAKKVRELYVAECFPKKPQNSLAAEQQNLENKLNRVSQAVSKLINLNDFRKQSFFDQRAAMIELYEAISRKTDAQITQTQMQQLMQTLENEQISLTETLDSLHQGLTKLGGHLKHPSNDVNLNSDSHDKSRNY